MIDFTIKSICISIPSACHMRVCLLIEYDYCEHAFHFVYDIVF